MEWQLPVLATSLVSDPRHPACAAALVLPLHSQAGTKRPSNEAPGPEKVCLWGRLRSSKDWVMRYPEVGVRCGQAWRENMLAWLLGSVCDDAFGFVLALIPHFGSPDTLRQNDRLFHLQGGPGLCQGTGSPETVHDSGRLTSMCTVERANILSKGWYRIETPVKLACLEQARLSGVKLRQ